MDANKIVANPRRRKLKDRENSRLDFLRFGFIIFARLRFQIRIERYLCLKHRNSTPIIIILCLALALLCGCAVLETRGTQGDQIVLAQPLEGLLAVYFIDVGQADSALVLCGDAMLIDGGNAADSSLIYSFLGEKGVDSLDYIVCTHAHEDHAGGLSGALNAASVETVLAPVGSAENSPFTKFVSAVTKLGLDITVPSAGDAFYLGDAEVWVLGPVKEYSDPNNTSIVLKIIYGETSFLFTGDMERQAELDLIGSGCDLSANVLKVSHHGSSTSSFYVFLYEVEPSYAVISCGKNNDNGHPHEEVLSRLSDADVTLYRTDIHGTVACYSDGISLSFETEVNAAPVTSNPKYENAYYIGNKNSRILHIPVCGNLPAEKNRVMFQNLEDALMQGYSTCKNCMG